MTKEDDGDDNNNNNDSIITMDGDNRFQQRRQLMSSHQVLLGRFLSNKSVEKTVVGKSLKTANKQKFDDISTA